MSHCLGVRCGMCEEVLVADDCPERGCPGGHGFTHQAASAWAARTWPNHECFSKIVAANLMEDYVQTQSVELPSGANVYVGTLKVGQSASVDLETGAVLKTCAKPHTFKRRWVCVEIEGHDGDHQFEPIPDPPEEDL